MKLKEQVSKSYLLLNSEHVNIMSTFKNKKVWLIQVNYYLALVSVCEMLTLEWGANVNQIYLTLRLLMSYIYGAPSKARNANVVYIWTYVWQR